ncbi:MAG TPA: GNAT family N-acetyltransferase, partial [Plasticicumulans sp.]|nr:GNAT family N-acetyltransferase [Plasticicumulans sp.]
GREPWIGPLAFVVGTVSGILAALAGLHLPFLEGALLTSLVVGVVLLFAPPPKVSRALPVAAVLGADGSDLCAPVRMQVPDTWLLVGMTIFSPWRNYGLGHRLLVQACSQARAAGFDRVSLIACEHNPATRLYRREGFTVVERRPILPHPLLAYAGDVLLMVRALP